MDRKYRRYTTKEKLEAVETMKKEGICASKLSRIIGIDTTSLIDWKNAYEKKGMEGLKSKIAYTFLAKQKPLLIREKVLQYKRENPRAGVKQISAGLERFHFLKICKETVRRILRGKEENNKESNSLPYKAKPKPQSKKRVKFFVRSLPNQLWQMDIFTWMLRGVYRTYIIAAIDDCSRFIVGWGLFRVQSADNVLEVLKGAIEKHGYPEEILTDNGRQFYSWRGKAKFQKTVVKMGIRHIRSRPHHPQTLGKIESFWRNIWRELLCEHPFSSFEEAHKAIGVWIEKYNYNRPHQGLTSQGRKIVPADKYFNADKIITKAVEEGIKETEEFLKNNPSAIPAPVYLAGKIGGKDILIRARDGNISIQGLDTNSQYSVLSQSNLVSGTGEVCKKEENVLQLNNEASSKEGEKELNTFEKEQKDGQIPQGSPRIPEDNGVVAGEGCSQNMPGNEHIKTDILHLVPQGNAGSGEGTTGQPSGQTQQRQSIGLNTGTGEDSNLKTGKQSTAGPDKENAKTGTENIQ